MSTRGRFQSLNAVRVATLLLPLLGLILLWRSSQISRGRKFFGTVGLCLFSILHAAVIVLLLMRFTGLEIEWRGGFPPVLTWQKTKPNYHAVEASRKAQRKSVQPKSAREFSGYWSEFRGPKRDGHYDEKSISTNWPPAGLRLLWRQPIGGGYASFAIAEGLAFTIEQRREKEFVTACDIDTGREVWAHHYKAFFDEPLGGEGPRATPTYDDGKIYSLGALGDLLCLETAGGKVIWQRNIYADNHADLLTYGMASSPLMVGEKIIVQAGGPRGQSVVAYHKITGKPIWKSLNDPAAYSSPMLVEFAGKRQLLVVTAERAVGLAIEDGKLLWMCPWVVNLGNRNIAQPVLLGANQFLLSAGYGTGCSAFEVTQTNSIFSTRLLWKNKFLKNKFSSSVFYDGCIYGLDEDILTCLDAKTGERKWKDGRFGYGQVLLASGHLIILSGEGELALVKATPEKFEELARFQAIHGKTWNNPAIADGKIFVRNAVEMACFDLGK